MVFCLFVCFKGSFSQFWVNYSWNRLVALDCIIQRGVSPLNWSESLSRFLSHWLRWTFYSGNLQMPCVLHVFHNVWNSFLGFTFFSSFTCIGLRVATVVVFPLVLTFFFVRLKQILQLHYVWWYYCASWRMRSVVKLGTVVNAYLFSTFQCKAQIHLLKLV